MIDESMEGGNTLAEQILESEFQEQCGCRIGYLEQESGKKEETLHSGSTFTLRLLLSLILFCSFFWLHKEQKTLFGYRTEKVAEILSQNTDLQALSKSVKMIGEER